MRKRVPSPSERYIWFEEDGAANYIHICMYESMYVDLFIISCEYIHIQVYIYVCFLLSLKYSSRNVQSRNMVSTEQQSKTHQLNIFFYVLNPFFVKHSLNKEICIRLSINTSPASIIVYYV